MKPRSDRFLRQDLFFPAVFSIIAFDAIGGDYGKQEADWIRDKVVEYCAPWVGRKKALKIFIGAINDCYDILLPAVDKQERILDGLKLIFIVFNLANEINENTDFVIPPAFQEIFDKNFEQAQKQKVRYAVRDGEVILKEFSDEDFEKLLESTKKQARKVFEELNKKKYFIKK